MPSPFLASNHIHPSIHPPLIQTWQETRTGITNGRAGWRIREDGAERNEHQAARTVLVSRHTVIILIKSYAAGTELVMVTEPLRDFVLKSIAARSYSHTRCRSAACFFETLCERIRGHTVQWSHSSIGCSAVYHLLLCPVTPSTIMRPCHHMCTRLLSPYSYQKNKKSV